MSFHFRKALQCGPRIQFMGSSELTLTHTLPKVQILNSHIASPTPLPKQNSNKISPTNQTPFELKKENTMSDGTKTITYHRNPTMRSMVGRIHINLRTTSWKVERYPRLK